MQRASVVVILANSRLGQGQINEIALADRLSKRTVPLVTDQSLLKENEALATRQGLIIGGSTGERLAMLTDAAAQLLQLAERERPNASAQDPEDPQKGRWGGQSERNGRRLTAAVRELSPGWFEVTLTVSAIGSKPLVDDVHFYLHPTFARPVEAVRPMSNRAVLTLTCWGAFTVGVLTDAGSVQLELDLSADPTFPRTFAER